MATPGYAGRPSTTTVSAMTSVRPVHGIVETERPHLLHRFGTIANRSSCGKAIVPRPDGETSKLLCRRCTVIHDTRIAGKPDWFEFE